MGRLIITNGDSAAALLRASGLEAEVLEWRDVLTDGPVPADPCLEAVSDRRAAYLAGALGLDPAAVRADFARRDAVLRAHGDYESVELWFEHDLFDQMQLLQLLAFFAAEPERPGLRLMQAHTYLGVQTPEAMIQFEAMARPLRARQLATGQSVWAAFTAPTPNGLVQYAAQAIPELPALAAALRRLLAEFPAPLSGLSLTQERALRLLAQGPCAIGHLFGAVIELEEAQFMGDLSFFQCMEELALAPEPLLTGLLCPVRDLRSFTPDHPPGSQEQDYRAYVQRVLHLTPAGHAALANQFDHATSNRIDRWIGGIHVTQGHLWRYARDQGHVIPPDHA